MIKNFEGLSVACDGKTHVALDPRSAVAPAFAGDPLVEDDEEGRA